MGGIRQVDKQTGETCIGRSIWVRGVAQYNFVCELQRSVDKNRDLVNTV